MTKELEFLESMKDCLTPNGDIFEHTKKYKDIHKALQRLEAIDNAKPSEALKCVDVLKEDDCITTLYQGKALETIRQYILKAQENEKENAELRQHIKRWHDLLLKTGINSKGTVADEIENYWAIKVEK